MFKDAAYPIYNYPSYANPSASTNTVPSIDYPQYSIPNYCKFMVYRLVAMTYCIVLLVDPQYNLPSYTVPYSYPPIYSKF